jgi:hypothetical protein
MGVAETVIHSSTTLQSDLGMSGDDAAEFMEWFFAEFAVSPAEFSFDTYFPPEHGIGLWDLLTRRSRKPITVQHLCECVDRRSWFTPVPDR